MPFPQSQIPLKDLIRERNPFYFASALSVLAGAYLFLGPERFASPSQTLLLGGVLQIYELCVLAAAGLILYMFRARWDVWTLFLVAAVFLFDAPMLHMSLGLGDPETGIVVGGGTVLLALAAFHLISMFTTSKPLFGLSWRTGLAGVGWLCLIALGPSIAGFLKRQTLFSTHAQVHYLLAAFPALYLLMIWRRDPAPEQGAGHWVLTGITLIAPAAAAVHVLIGSVFIYGDGGAHLFPAFITAMLLASTAGPLAYLFAGLRLGWRRLPEGAGAILPACCVGMSAAISASIPEAIWVNRIFPVSPLQITLMAMAFYFLAVWRRLSVNMLGRIGVAAFLALTCPGVEEFFENAAHPNLLFLGALHIFAIPALTRGRESWQPLAAAAIAAGWALWLHGATDFVWPSLAVTVGTSLFAPILILFDAVRPGRWRWRFLAVAVLVSGTVYAAEVNEAAGVDAAAYGLCAVAVSAGWWLKDRALLATGAALMIARGAWQIIEIVGWNVRAMGALALFAGFLVLFVGVVVSFWPFPNLKAAHRAADSEGAEKGRDRRENP